MKDQKKSRKSGSNRHIARVIFALLPLPLALSLTLFPELGDLELIPVILVFLLGMVIGTITHIYWLRTLLQERKFYVKFYNESAMKPRHMEKGMHRKHTRILLPFYLFGALLFIVLIFVFGIFTLDFAYALPFILGAMEGVPISYYLMERGVFS